MSKEKYPWSNVSWRSLYALWLLLGLIFGAIGLLIIKNGNPGFSNTMVFALSAIIVGMLLYLGEQGPPNVYAMLVGSILACFPVVAAASLFDATTAMWLSGAGIFIVWILNSQKDFGERDKNTTAFVLIPMGVWTFWAFVYLYQHITGTMGLAWQSGFFYFGILLFAGFSIFRFVGAVSENEKTQKWTFYLLLLAVIGMLLMTNLGLRLSFA
jgi:hypothetical protein